MVECVARYLERGHLAWLTDQLPHSLQSSSESGAHPNATTGTREEGAEEIGDVRQEKEHKPLYSGVNLFASSALFCPSVKLLSRLSCEQ